MKADLCSSAEEKLNIFSTVSFWSCEPRPLSCHHGNLKMTPENSCVSIKVVLVSPGGSQMCSPTSRRGSKVTSNTPAPEQQQLNSSLSINYYDFINS